MPILNIQLPQKQLERAKIRARKEGFKNPAEWARVLVSRHIAFEESPKLKSSEIIKAMKKTGIYRLPFLQKLKSSLDYADKTAK